MRTRTGLLVLLVLGTALWVPALHARGDLNPPEVLGRWWEPRYPIAPEIVTLFARVQDPDGVKSVGVVWCYIPPTLCQYPPLYDDGTNGDAVAGDEIWTNDTVLTHPLAEGASYKLTAVDDLDNVVQLGAIYALFVDALSLTLTPAVLSSVPGEPVTVNGTAFYESNGTAPAETVVVTVSIRGSSAQATVDASGNFSVNMTAPATEDTYTVTATATDRTLTGSAEGVLAVSTVPRPDLRVRNVRPSHPIPMAGEPLSVTFEVGNLGSEDALGVQVLVDVSRTGSWTTIYDKRINLAKGGGGPTLAAEFTPEEGVYTIRVRVDPGGEFDELNETNNEVTAIVSARAPDLPVLWIAAGGGIAAMAAAGGVLAVRRRRFRPAPSPSDKGKAL